MIQMQKTIVILEHKLERRDKKTYNKDSNKNINLTRLLLNEQAKLNIFHISGNNIEWHKFLK